MKFHCWEIGGGGMTGMKEDEEDDIQGIETLEKKKEIRIGRRHAAYVNCLIDLY